MALTKITTNGITDSGVTTAKVEDGTITAADLASGVTDLSNDTSPQLGGNLDTNSQNIGIDDANGILDENSNEQLIFQTTASAVNHLEITNSATSNNPSLSATGGDTNVGLEVSTKGSGYIKFNDLAYIPQQALTSSSNAVAWDVQAKPNAYHLTTENTTFAAPTNSVEGSYTNKLLTDKSLSKAKVLEEIDELIEAIEENTNKIHEAADVFYHLLMYLEANDVKIEEVMEELEKRKK